MNSAITIDAQNTVQLKSQKPSQGWHYLIAEQVVFEKSHIAHEGRAIRIQKPEAERVPQWIKRLIQSGNCEAIYVENLELSESEKLAIRALCTKFSVSLVGLTINDAEQANVIQGPW